MDWEFYVCCLTNENSVWTRWRWRALDAGRVIAPQTDFTTLTACKADAVLHGFDPSTSRVVKVDGELRPSEGHLNECLPTQSAA